MKLIHKAGTDNGFILQLNRREQFVAFLGKLSDLERDPDTRAWLDFSVDLLADGETLESVDRAFEAAGIQKGRGIKQLEQYSYCMKCNCYHHPYPWGACKNAG